MKNRNLWFWSSYLIAVGVIMWGIIIYPHLPAQVVMHWNASGDPDRFASRQSLIWMALLVIAMPVLMDLLPYIDPRKNNYRYFSDAYQKMKLGITLVMAFLLVLTVQTNLSFSHQLSTKAITVGLGALLMLFGNYLAKVRNNYFIGIRTPWTLSSDEVWRRTHRVGGWFYFLAGLITVVLGLLLEGRILFVLFMVLVLAAAFIPMIYSYFLYQRLNGDITDH